MADALEQPPLRARSHRRTRRWILIAAGGLLVGFGALIVLTPVADDDGARSCGGAPSVAAAVGLDSAAEGDGDWCRSEGRFELALGALVFVLPGAVLLRWQFRPARRAGLPEPDPIDRSPTPGEPDRSVSQREALPEAPAPSDAVPCNRMDLYVDPRQARGMLLLAPMTFLLPPAMWFLARSAALGLRRRPVLTLDDTGLTDHRYRLEVPWPLVRSVTLDGRARAQIAVDVSDLRPLRPSWRLGAALRWAVWRVLSSGRRIRLPAHGIDGVAAFVDQAASRIHPVPQPEPDRLVLYRSPWWLVGLPGGVAALVLLLRLYLDPTDEIGEGLIVIPAALWFLWRGVGAVRGRPLLLLDREGITDRRHHGFHATWDEVVAVEPASAKWNELLVRLRQHPVQLDRFDRDGHASPPERRLVLDGLSMPAHEIVHVAEHLHAGPRDGVPTYSPATGDGRPSRVAAGAAIATAILVAGVGWYTRPSGDLGSADCYRESNANQVRFVPCDQPHDGEILLELDHPADDAVPFPGTYTLHTWANDRCDPASPGPRILTLV
jgi:hypothetical protein